MKRLVFAYIIASAMIVGACSTGPSPEEARSELAKMNITYDTTTFIERAGASDPVVVKLFLAAGMDPNAKDSHGNTALGSATRQGDLLMVRTLLDNGAKVDRKVDSWYDRGEIQYPIGLDVVAAGAGHTEITELLLEQLIAETPSQEGELFTHAFWYACLSGQEVTAKALLPRLKRPLNEQDLAKALKTGLHYATSGGESAGLVEFLLDHGAPIDDRDEFDGFTPLHNAAAGGHLEVVRLLIKRGADIHILNKEGESAYVLATMNDHSDVSQILNVEMAKQGNPFSQMELESSEYSGSKHQSTSSLKPWEIDWSQRKQSSDR